MVATWILEKRFSRSTTCACSLACFLFFALTHPITAHAAAPENAITMISEPGEFIGGGVDRAFTGAEVSESAYYKSPEFLVFSGSGSDGAYSFEFDAPKGKQLEVGEYTHATNSPEKGSAGLNISGGGRGCPSRWNRFDVLELGLSGGTVDRFRATYEQKCEGPSAPAVFGEVRYHAPPSSGPAAVPSAVSWPETPVGQTSVVVPVKLEESTPEQGRVTSLAIEGEDASEFVIAQNGCVELPLAACALEVAAQPRAGGTRTAELSVRVEGGAETTIPLRVETEPLPEPLMAANAYTVVDEPGGLFSGGLTRLFDAPESVTARPEGEGIQVVAEANGEWFYSEFYPAAGKRLEAGEYIAPREGSYPFEAPVLRISGDGAGCNTTGRFIVKDIQAEGSVERFWALYEAHCENLNGIARPALFGEVRVGEPMPEAPEAVAPAAIEWPETQVGSAGTAVPVTVGAREAPVTIGAVSLGGVQGESFAITGDECAGARLAPRQRCTIWVSARPQSQEHDEGQLIIADASGHETVVPLGVWTEPPHPPAMTQDWATVDGEAGHVIGDSHDVLLDSPDGASLSGNSGLVHLEASDGEGAYSFELAAAPGKRLELGEFKNARRVSARGHSPGLSVADGGHTCSADNGRFVIEDIGFTPAGVPDRLRALYEEHCQGHGAPEAFGEVRFGEPAGEAPETVAPQAITWPETKVSKHAAGLPVTVGAGSNGATITSVAVEGEGASSFAISDDECVHRPLARLQRCEVTVTPDPRSAGPLHATLVLTDQLGNRTAVPLSIVGLPKH